MAYRTEEIKMYKDIVICDGCQKELVLWEQSGTPLGFDNRMNRTIQLGFTFKNVDGVFKNYCKKCNS